MQHVVAIAPIENAVMALTTDGAYRFRPGKAVVTRKVLCERTGLLDRNVDVEGIGGCFISTVQFRQ